MNIYQNMLDNANTQHKRDQEPYFITLNEIHFTNISVSAEDAIEQAEWKVSKVHIIFF